MLPGVAMLKLYKLMPPGDVFDPEQIETELKDHTKAKFVALVHAETSTDALQPSEDIAKITHEHDPY